jgi:Na+-translocating ferredoxin:NAD+ oxidoreductase RNF subunit RnfB
VPCRDGLWQAELLIESISDGKAEGEVTVETLKDVMEMISTLGCDFTSGCADLVLQSLSLYADEWELHAKRHRCTALKCEAYYDVYIDPAACTGCGACLKAAPAGAIAGGEGMIHVVKNDAELKGDAFAAVCPAGAIKKFSGMVKPRVPEEPVAVGSFGAAGAGAAGGRRRRRG